MSASKRTALDKQLEALTTRQQAKAANLAEARAALASLNEDLSKETENAKWEALTDQHGKLNIRIAALIAELAVITDKVRVTRLAISDYELSQVQADISKLVTENYEIRTKRDALQDEFRRLITRSSSDLDAKQRVVEVKNDLAQLALGGELNRRELDAAKHKRDLLTGERGALEIGQ